MGSLKKSMRLLQLAAALLVATNAMEKCCVETAYGELKCKDDSKPAKEEEEPQTCPPKGWDRCGGTWPPPANGYCCSSYNFLGTSSWHCERNGGINALDHCCVKNKDGSLSCQ